MAKYFGTDGIRGEANVTLTATQAFLIGRYIGHYFSQNKKAKIIIGKDTRISGAMFEAAVVAGANASGCDVYLVGVIPTPAIAYLTQQYGFDCGVMISASHNPYYDNGIKLFNCNGEKMTMEFENEIEAFIDSKITIPYTNSDNIGGTYEYLEANQKYLDYLKSIDLLDLSGVRIALDLANGAAVTTAQQLLESLGATVDAIGNTPNGKNINLKVGSTYPETLQDFVKKGHYDVGFSFDGDADRVMAVDEQGQLVDGDKILYLAARSLKERNKLSKNTIATTVMANIGLYHALKELDIKTVKTKVGDKYVYEAMTENNYVLGGEQSGHIIFKEYATTGDGLLCALKILEYMTFKKQNLSELLKDINIFPQLLINVTVNDKENVLQDSVLTQKIDAIQNELGSAGRILVRPSGTEPLVRVMVEAQSEELCHKYVYEIINYIKEKEANN